MNSVNLVHTVYAESTMNEIRILALIHGSVLQYISTVKLPMNDEKRVSTDTVINKSIEEI